jgi:putative endonuclease
MGLARERGRAGEDLAAAYLELTGCSVLARNPEVGGVEVDLVVQDGTAHVLVEVKFRRRSDFGGAAMAVDHQKRDRLRRAAAAALRAGARRVRVDVVAIELSEDGAAVRHYRDAVHDR